MLASDGRVPVGVLIRSSRFLGGCSTLLGGAASDPESGARARNGHWFGLGPPRSSPLAFVTATFPHRDQHGLVGMGQTPPEYCSPAEVLRSLPLLEPHKGQADRRRPRISAESRSGSRCDESARYREEFIASRAGLRVLPVIAKKTPRRLRALRNRDPCFRASA